ncbi:hypothetical protein [Streptomyces abyssomicinicus]|uniref:hypothetical protein n=1 Tax=Streptomyces abyssomicinicus TaxID=574929 RepID=UPI00124F8B8C|nr:hypothetical protein [Streptomyces abyssomicinicus]
MEVVLARTALAPLLVLGVSLAARRSGPATGGRLMGAPTSTGPFLLLVCLESGTASASRAAHGCVTGQLVVVCFCLAYGRLAHRFPPVGTLLGALGIAAVGAVAGTLSGNVWLTALLSVTVTVAGLLTWPPATTRARALPDPSWEILVRMTLAALTVFCAAGVARAAGPFLGGVLSSLPMLLMVMTPSAHRAGGATAAAAVSRAAMTSAGGTLAFLLTVAAALVPCGTALAMLLGLAAMTLVDQLIRRGLHTPGCGRRMPVLRFRRSNAPPAGP